MQISVELIATKRCVTTQITALLYFIIDLACVASISSRGSSRKLGQEQKKMNDGGQNRGVCGQAVPSFPSPSPVIHFFLLLSQFSR